MATRRKFIGQTVKAAAATYVGALGMSARSYGRILGANDRVNVGIVGFSDRFRSSLLPSFLGHSKELNFDIIAVSDIWSMRREEGKAQLSAKVGHDVKACVNNDALYAMKDVDAVCSVEQT